MKNIKSTVSFLCLFVMVLAGWALFNSQARQGRTPQNNDGRFMELGKVQQQAPKAGEANVVLNDPNMSKSWGLATSDAEKAWNVSLGSRKVVVAVIDTGIDVYHRDLKNNLWNNPGESGKDAQGHDKATNGKDDDGNGFVDDVHGWNFVHNSPDLKDNHGHGTHIAGIIGAEGGNQFGISGVSPQVSLMILKYYDPYATGANNLKNTIRAIEYATAMGAQVINYSGGGTEYSKDEFKAVENADRKGILFVAAAGNEKSNSDVAHYYPANYGLKNIISVTAINPQIETLPSSNYGVQTVDLAAPGFEIYSSLPGGQFGTMTGTSQATAFVSGVAALVLAQFPTFNSYEVKKYILKTGDISQSLATKTGTARKLNIYKALTTLDQGVGANGVAATNMGRTHNGTYFSDSANDSQGSGDATVDMADFGKSLLKNLPTQTRDLSNTTLD